MTRPELNRRAGEESARGTAIITGGASGIGRATARQLSSDGFHVIVADVDEAAANATAREVGGSAAHLDVGNADQWKAFAAQAGEFHQSLTALVLNAGLAGAGGNLAELDTELYRRIWRVNVDGVVLGLSHMLPLLIRARASVAITCSVAGLTGVAWDPIYAMTKHALIGLVRSCGPDLGERGVRLQAICPGLVETPLLGHGHDQLTKVGFPLLVPEEVAQLLADCVTGRVVDPILVCQPGREPIAYQLQRLPGPRSTDGSTIPDLPRNLSIGAHTAEPGRRG